LSDLAKARELEQLRYTETLKRLNLEEQKLIRTQNADFAGRNLFQSGARLMATAKARIDRIESGIDARLEIRKELARSVPELGSDRELDELLAAILRSVDNAAASPLRDVPPGAVRDALKARVDQDIYRLKAGAKTKIEILKRELALKLHEQQEPRSMSIATGGGPALVNLGTIHGGVQQVIGGVSEAGYRELADLLPSAATCTRHKRRRSAGR
jgi:hypothetical protein